MGEPDYIERLVPREFKRYEYATYIQPRLIGRYARKKKKKKETISTSPDGTNTPRGQYARPGWD